MKTLLSWATIFCLLWTTKGFAQEDIFSAARSNNVDLLKTLLLHINIDTIDYRGSTPLIIAVYNENKEATQLLLHSQANVNVSDKMGNTALMGACFRGYEEITELLLLAKVNVNQRNYNGATALTFAATFGHLNLVKKLIAYGADKTIRDNSGKTPLDHARMQENEEMIQLLQ